MKNNVKIKDDTQSLQSCVSDSVFDFEEFACHEGHITEDAHNYTCGGKYQYNGIMSRGQRLSNPRGNNTYLKYASLKDVKCDKCRELKYKQLVSEHYH